MNFKRILSLVLVLILSLGIFAGCGNKGGDDNNTPTGATLDQALSYLDTIYKSQNGVKDVKNYDVVAKVLLNGGADVFTITWTVDNANITIKESTEAGFYTVVLPASNTEEVNYKLTATVRNAAGETAVYTVNKILGKYQATVEGASELVEGQAYKLYTAQKYAQKHLFATAEIDQGKYYVSTEDYTAALDFYAEKVEGGYQFYTNINGAKKYIDAYLGGSEGTSKRLQYADSTTNVWTYDSEYKVWCVTINGAVYMIGTYGTYETFCISDYSYITGSQASTQYPASFITPEQAAALEPFQKADASTAPEVGKGYVLSADNAGGTLYFVGGLQAATSGDNTGNRFTGSFEEADATVVFVAAGTDADTFLLYYVIDGASKYVVINDTSIGGDLTDVAAEASVFKWDAVTGTMVVADPDNLRGFAIAANKDFSTFNTYMAGQDYNFATFTLKADAVAPALPNGTGSGTPGTDTPGTDTPGTDTPGTDTPGTNYGVVDPVVGTAYKFGMVQGNLNATYYLAGGMSSYYLATTDNVANAVDVYLEETTGGYYLYYLNGETKTYVNMVVALGTDSKYHANPECSETASTVYTYDSAKQTIVVTLTVGDAEAEAYWFGTRNDKTYNTVGPCAVRYNGFYCQFYAAGAGTDTPGTDTPGTDTPGTDTPGTDTPAAGLPGNLSFTAAANKADGDTYLSTNFPTWTITGTLGQTYGGYLGFGRGTTATRSSAIKSSAISVSSAFTVTAVIKGNGSSGVMTSTLTFTLVDASGNTIATGYANGSDTAAITPVDATDTTYNISFTFVDGKTWTDVSNLVVSFAKDTGNIGLFSLNFVQ